MKTKYIGIMALFGAIYFSLGFLFQNVSFGPVNVRVADALYPLIALLGLPGLLGCFVGQLAFNSYGVSVGIALGPGDLLSPFIFLIPKFLIWKFGLKAVPVHVLAVALWIGTLLYFQFGIPLWLSFLTVGLGECVAEIGLGVPLALSFKRAWILGQKKKIGREKV